MAPSSLEDNGPPLSHHHARKLPLAPLPLWEMVLLLVPKAAS